MKIKTLVTTALIAVGVGWAAQSARATLTWTAGDVFLGFRQGDSKGYLVNLGNIALYSAKNGASFTVNTGGNIGLDLAGAFSTINTNWYSDPTVSWGAVATPFVGNPGDVPVLYVSRPRSDPSQQSVPWNGRSNSAQTATVSQFQSLAIKYGVEGVATPNSTKATLQGGGENTWAGFTSPPADFLVFGGIEAGFATGSANSVIDFYKINPGSGVPSEYLGNFSITDNGVITFTAVPEPGTVALLAIGALLVLYRIRRRNAHGA